MQGQHLALDEMRIAVAGRLQIAHSSADLTSFHSGQTTLKLDELETELTETGSQVGGVVVSRG